jgi:pimeloyl-ACP methyl ester carboxylesterase
VLLLAGVPVLLLAAGFVSTVIGSNELSRSFLRLLRYVLPLELALLLVLAVVGAIYQSRSNVRDRRLYPMPGKLIDMGGYRFHLYCTGEGGPTVVLNYGLSGSYLDWYFVQPEVARFTRVCSWDRSGYGWSDRSPKTQVPSAIAEELHQLLEQAGEKPPFILVGHSLGAFDARMYARLYPGQVAGLILVDGSYPDETLPFTWRSKLWLRSMQLLAPLGLPRWRGWCTSGREPIASLKGAFNCQSRVYRAYYEQWSAFPQSAQEVRKLGSMGDLPLVVISRDPNAKHRHPNDAVLLERELRWQQYQKEISRLSSHSTFIVAEGSDHSVPTQRPDVVVEGIRNMLEQVRASNIPPHQTH